MGYQCHSSGQLPIRSTCPLGCGYLLFHPESHWYPSLIPFLKLHTDSSAFPLSCQPRFQPKQLPNTAVAIDIYLLKKWICNEHMSESCWQSSRRWTASGSNCLEANGMLKGNIRWIRLPFVLPHLPCAHMSNSNYSTVHVWVYVCVCGGGGGLQWGTPVSGGCLNSS